MIENVTKRDGSIVQFDSDKINQWVSWASETCDISWSDVVFKAVRSAYDGISTRELHDSLITSCLTYRTEAHSKMAARLLVGKIYKDVFDDFSIPSLSDFYHEMINAGLWEDMGYSEKDLSVLDECIDHTRDFTYSYATLKQFVDKYSISVNNKIHESPQFAFMGIAMSNMRGEKEDRLENVVNAYDALSSLKINLPTPTLGLERTPQIVAPSCCVISGNDTVESIGAATHVAYTMTAKSSGIGIEIETRAPKDPVKGGKLNHGGKNNYYKHILTSVNANKQIIRGGSATVTFNVLDPEIMGLLSLKGQRTDPDYRIDGLDYSMAVNHLFLKKVAENSEWMLVSPYYAKDLWDCSYKGSDKFEEVYDQVLNDSSVPKKMVKARDILINWIKYRGDTSRVFITFLDNVNSHTPFYDSIRLSNLCQEVLLPTKGYSDVGKLYSEGIDGEVALCNLGAIVVSNIKSDEDYERTTYILTKITDNSIENGTYPFKNVEMTAKARRSIGIGMTDVAHLMAKENMKYDSLEGRNFIHKLAERHSFFLHKASVQLSKERGACDWFQLTKYSDGWLPIDTYSKAVDSVHSQPLVYDWESLRADIIMHGTRFSVLEAFMPTESSSVLTNSTNSIYPVRDLEMYKESRKGVVYFRASGMDDLDYQSAYDIDHMDMVKFYSIVQKFTGQGISADFYTSLDGETKISTKDMIKRVLYAAKMGMKTFYYENVDTSDETDCSSCKI